MNIDTQAELTIEYSGKSIKMKPLTAREYAKFLREQNSKKDPADLIEYYVDYMKSKAITDGDSFEDMTWATLQGFSQEYIKANSVTPDDKKKSE